MSKNTKQKLLISAGILAGTFVVLDVLGKHSKAKDNKNIDDDNQYLSEQGSDTVDSMTDDKRNFYLDHGKRIVDKTLSFAGLVVLAPVYAAISLAIVLDDPGPVLFTQKRVGKDKHFFKLHKFRSMKMSTPHDMPTHMLSNPDQYITRVGKFLRKSSLDELPQIWDIFVGNMSIIGPRPALWNQDDLIAERDKYHANDINPGLTGWAQINGRDELEISDKAKLDGDYVSNIYKNSKCGFIKDVQCFFATIKSVSEADGIVEGGTGRLHIEKNEEDKIPQKNRILVISQYYYPEPFRISDCCEELVRRGNEVTVYTGIPNYPEGEIYTEYKNGNKKNEVLNGVEVHRCFTIPRKKGTAYRVLNYYSYVVSSCTAVIKSIFQSPKDDFDVVFVNQLSPVIMAEAGILYKNIHHKKLVLYCLDLWPESLLAGGVKRNSIIFNSFYHISKNIYADADEILVSSKSFKEYMGDKFGISEKKINYLPQYAEDIFSELNYDKDVTKDSNKFNFVFAGNIGKSQDIETILRAANRLKSYPNIKFHIIGNGSELEILIKTSKRLKLGNVIFYGRKDIADMPYYFKMADAMLITLGSDDFLNMTLPGKIQSYMSAGKPIIGACDGETSSVITEAGCGLVCSSGDDCSLSNNILNFIKLDSYQRKLLGIKSRDYYLTHFSKKVVIDKLENSLLKMKLR